MDDSPSTSDPASSPIAETSSATTYTIEQPGNREALLLWHKVLLEGVKNQSFDLSARQMAIVLTIYLQEGPHTIRGLSEMLNVSKPAICRAIDSLEKNELIIRKKDDMDRRNVYILDTDTGHLFLGTFSESILNHLMEIQ